MNEDRSYLAARIKQQREIDEAVTLLVDHMPRTWRSLYLRLMEEGFNEEEALSLVKCFILKDATYGVHFHSKD